MIEILMNINSYENHIVKKSILKIFRLVDLVKKKVQFVKCRVV